MYLSELQNKDIINVKDGKRLGNIIDIGIDNDGKINGLMIQKNRISFFKNNNEEEIKWEQIKRIGEDVILVDTN